MKIAAPARPRRVDAVLAVTACAALAFALGYTLVVDFDPAFAQAGDATMRLAADTAPYERLALNALPTLLAALLLLALTRRPLLSAALAGVLTYALYLANALKLGHLGTPLLPADLELLGHLGDGGDLLAHYLSDEDRWRFGVAVVVLALLLCFEPRSSSLRGLPRWLLLGATLTLWTSLLANTAPWPQVYAATDDDFESWSPSESARRGGLPLTLLRYTWQAGAPLPSADAVAARDLILRHRVAPPATPPARDALPDIVIVQSESFFDPARLHGVSSAATLPEYRRLIAQTRHGDLWVPTYGGGTIRTEFEVLTGIAMRYFPGIEYPYFRLTSRSLPSFVRTLARQGYHTLAVHPNTRDFWNRAASFSRLGFDEFDSIEQFDPIERIGYYVSDHSLVDHVLDRLDRARGPMLLFAITMQNHGPYDGYPGVDPAELRALPVPDTLGAEPARRLRGYLYHLADADRALGRLAEALRQRNRRSLLLFYGDHLPALPNVYEQAGFLDGLPGNAQPVPWLLLDTAAAPTASAPETTAAFYLPALLLAAAGVEAGSYFPVLEDVRRQDHPQNQWMPIEDAGLAAIMRLRQRGEYRSFYEATIATAP